MNRANRTDPWFPIALAALFTAAEPCAHGQQGPGAAAQAPQAPGTGPASAVRCGAAAQDWRCSPWAQFAGDHPHPDQGFGDCVGWAQRKSKANGQPTKTIVLAGIGCGFLALGGPMDMFFKVAGDMLGADPQSLKSFSDTHFLHQAAAPAKAPPRRRPRPGPVRGPAPTAGAQP